MPARGRAGRSFPNDLDEDPFAAFPVELAVEDLFPRAKVKPAPGHRHDHFPAHDGAFEVGIGIVFGSIVRVLRVGLLGGQFFQPPLEVLVQPGLVVIDKYARGAVRCLFAN